MHGTEKAMFDTFRIDGWNVCESCFCSVYAISSSTWDRRKAEVKSGIRHWEHGSTGHGARMTEAGYASRIWMTDYFYTLGDYQPDTGQIHLLPSDQVDIFKEMSNDLEEHAVGKSQFYHIWSTEFSDVKIPPEQRLGKCKECDTFHKRIMGERDKHVREDIKKERKDHIQNVKADRLVYHGWRRKARENPDECMVVIVDGMDQAKTNVPNFNTSESFLQMTVRVVGALVHGVEKKSYAYLVTEYTKETNTNIEVLRQVLDAQPKLPPTLVIQLDNTSQENKNSHLFTFLAELVESGQVKQVIVNFLPVGHTHVCC